VIRSKQIAKIANEVISEFLGNGTFPSVQAVVSAITMRLQGTVPGTPLTKYTPVGFDTLTDPTVLNDLTDNIATDIQTLYDEDIDQINRIIRDFVYKDTRRSRIRHRISELSTELATLQCGPYIYSGSLAKVSSVDFDNSSASMNFSTYSIELPAVSNRTTKIDLSKATIKASIPAGSQVLGSVSNLTNSLQNQVYLVRAAASTNTCSIAVSVSFDTPQSFSKIVIEGHVASSTVAGIQIDSQVLTNQTLDIGHDLEWTFAPRPIKNLTITLSKQIPDATSGSTNYFDLGMKSISCYTEEYVSSAVFTTKPIAFENPLGTITLDVDQSVPPNCSVDWYMSVDGSGFNPIATGVGSAVGQLVALDTYRILPVKSIRESSRVYTLAASGNTGNQVDAGISVLSETRGGHTALFRLTAISTEVDYGQTKVWRGRNAWRVKSYHYDPSYFGLIQDPPPQIGDFIDPRGDSPQIFGRYQPTEYDIAHQYSALSATEGQAIRLPIIEGPFQGPNDRVMHLFEATLIVDPSQAPNILAGLRATNISLPIIFAAGKAVLYLNGQQVPVLSQTSGMSLGYSAVLNLVPGSNTLQIVTNDYASLGGSSFDIGTSVFQNLCAYGGPITWYADPAPMTEVSLFELQYQTSRNDFSRYARINSDNAFSQTVVVRELPTCIYDLTTMGLPQNSPKTVVLQARLSGSSQSKNLTPKINGYTLTASYPGVN
jgi:hypothetical protein